MSWVRPYERAVFVTAYGILRDHADAEEAAQETMLKAILHFDQLAEPDKFKSWLLQIALNEARLKRRAQHANLFEALDGSGNSSPEEGFKPWDFADWRQLPFDMSSARGGAGTGNNRRDSHSCHRDAAFDIAVVISGTSPLPLLKMQIGT